MSSSGALQIKLPAMAEPSADERTAHRYSLILRVAKLVGSDGETPCIVRDISMTGTRVKLFSDHPVAEHLFLELASGERFAMERIWQREGQAGFRFATEIDVSSFVAEASDYRRRPLRLRLNRPAVLTVGDTASPVIIANLSQHGAGIETELHLALAQQVTLSAEGIPPRVARVRWRRSGRYGLAFTHTFELAELARLAFRL